MKLVVEYTTSNGVEYWDHIVPLEYENKEQFLWDFFIVLEEYINRPKQIGILTDCYVSFKFKLGNVEFDADNFLYHSENSANTVGKLAINMPNCYELNEWFELKKGKQ